MSKKKNQIGKGIKALLGNIESNNSELEQTLQETKSASTTELLLSQIERNPNQPRTDFDPQEIEELAASIKAHGIIQPLTVRHLGGSTYQIIAGERRYRASKLAGLEKVPVYIRDADDVSLLEMALIENIQRTDLNALEIAISYQRLIEECHITHEDLSERVGKKRSTISNYVRLLKLPVEMQSSLKSGKITMGHARVLAGIDDPAKQVAVFQKIINLGLSVRAAESMAAGGSKSKASQGGNKNDGITTDVKRIQDQLGAKLGSRIKIERSKSGKGKIVIPFSNDADFNNIIESIIEE